MHDEETDPHHQDGGHSHEERSSGKPCLQDRVRPGDPEKRSRQTGHDRDRAEDTKCSGHSRSARRFDQHDSDDHPHHRYDVESARRDQAGSPTRQGPGDSEAEDAQHDDQETDAPGSSPRERQGKSP